jgi:hypothetical protein
LGINSSGKSPSKRRSFLRSAALRFSHDRTDLGSGVAKEGNPPLKTAGGKSFGKSDDIYAFTIR